MDHEDHALEDKRMALRKMQDEVLFVHFSHGETVPNSHVNATWKAAFLPFMLYLRGIKPPVACGTALLA
jgi:hypothetical protein